MPKKKPMTIDQVLRLRSVSNPQLSPDGTAIVYVVTTLDEESKEYHANLWMVPAVGGSARQLTFGAGGGRVPRWSPDGMTIAFVARRGDDTATQLWLLPVCGGEARRLTNVETAVSGIEWAPDGATLLYLAREPAGSEEQQLQQQGGIHVVDRFIHMTQIWQVDVATGACRQLTRDRSSKSSARWSPDGGRIAFEQRPDPTSNQSYRASIRVMDAGGRNKRKLSTGLSCDTEPRWSPDGRQIACLRRDTSGYARLTRLALMNADGDQTQVPTRVQTRVLTRVLTEKLDRSVIEAQWSADGRRIYAVVHDGPRQHVHTVTVKGGRMRQLTEGDRQVSNLQLPAAGRLVFLSEGPMAPAEVCVTDANGGSEAILTNTNPEVRGMALGRTRAVRWQSADGLQIEGMLVLPANHKKGSRAALVVEPHGGPAGARGFNFYANSQLLAGRGYAVLAPNFRGSAGYGQKFLGANEDDFGGGDFADVMAGVDAMIDKRIAHPTRLAIMGYSYGGYMTAWAIGQTRRFKAAIAGAGVINLTSFYGTTDIQWFTENYQRGTPWRRADSYRAQSPITHVGQVKTPTLIYHGDEDRRVPMEQSEQLYVSLRERGVPTQFVRYPREGHGIAEYWHRRDCLERITGWLKRWVT
jgi:dipeptidyl aminopeptidase/acylaminoacyl peptidase